MNAYDKVLTRADEQRFKKGSVQEYLNGYENLRQSQVECDWFRVKVSAAALWVRSNAAHEQPGDSAPTAEQGDQDERENRTGHDQYAEHHEKQQLRAHTNKHLA